MTNNVIHSEKLFVYTNETTFRNHVRIHLYAYLRFSSLLVVQLNKGTHRQKARTQIPRAEFYTLMPCSVHVCKSFVCVRVFCIRRTRSQHDRIRRTLFCRCCTIPLSKRKKKNGEETFPLSLPIRTYKNENKLFSTRASLFGQNEKEANLNYDLIFVSPVVTEGSLTINK